MKIIIEAIATGSATLLSNPSFVRLGLIGLFINGLLSSVIPIPIELTTSGLLLAGQSKISISAVLVIGSILGGFVAYYIGYGGVRFLKRLRKNQIGKARTEALLC